jgi:hypothetical protein
MFLDLARGDPHDGDGVADHVGGTLLTLGPLGIATERLIHGRWRNLK